MGKGNNQCGKLLDLVMVILTLSNQQQVTAGQFNGESKKWQGKLLKNWYKEKKDNDKDK